MVIRDRDIFNQQRRHQLDRIDRGEPSRRFLHRFVIDDLRLVHFSSFAGVVIGTLRTPSC